MKKSIINTIPCLALLAPLDVMAMEPITEAETDAVTGQKGVSPLLQTILHSTTNRGLKASDITGTLEWLICWTNVRDNAA